MLFSHICYLYAFQKCLSVVLFYILTFWWLLSFLMVKGIIWLCIQNLVFLGVFSHYALFWILKYCPKTNLFPPFQLFKHKLFIPQQDHGLFILVQLTNFQGVLVFAVNLTFTVHICGGEYLFAPVNASLFYNNWFILWINTIPISLHVL